MPAPGSMGSELGIPAECEPIHPMHQGQLLDTEVHYCFPHRLEGMSLVLSESWASEVLGNKNSPIKKKKTSSAHQHVSKTLPLAGGFLQGKPLDVQVERKLSGKDFEESTLSSTRACNLLYCLARCGVKPFVNWTRSSQVSCSVRVFWQWDTELSALSVLGEPQAILMLMSGSCCPSFSSKWSLWNVFSLMPG